jgi:hypothetical protein
MTQSVMLFVPAASVEVMETYTDMLIPQVQAVCLSCTTWEVGYYLYFIRQKPLERGTSIMLLFSDSGGNQEEIELR